MLDLKDAYYYIPIISERRKFLQYQLERIPYEFTCLPNELLSAPPHVFTKLLCGKIILLLAYNGDIILIADSKEALELSINKAIAMITEFRMFLISSPNNLNVWDTMQ